MDVRTGLKRDDLARVLRLTPARRAELALDLGARSLDLLCWARGLTRDAARQFVRDAKRRSRQRP